MNADYAVTIWDGVNAARPAITSPQPNDRLTEMFTGVAHHRRRHLGRGGRAADTSRRIATGPNARTADVIDHVLLIPRIT